MTTDQKAAQRKLSMLALAAEFNYVSKASRIMGCGRQQFCKIHRKPIRNPVTLHLAGSYQIRPRAGENIFLSWLDNGLLYVDLQPLRVAQAGTRQAGAALETSLSSENVGESEIAAARQ